MSKIEHRIVWKTDIYITQEEYDKLYQLFQRARISSSSIRGFPRIEIDSLAEISKEKYESYRIHLSDKYNIELLRSDGSYFACEELRVVYVLDVTID